MDLSPRSKHRCVIIWGFGKQELLSKKLQLIECQLIAATKVTNLGGLFSQNCMVQFFRNEVNTFGISNLINTGKNNRLIRVNSRAFHWNLSRMLNGFLKLMLRDDWA